MKTKLLILIAILLTNLCFGQYGIRLNTPEASEGYTLLTTKNKTFLINNCGEIVHEWNVPFPKRHCKLLPNGNLLFMTNSSIIEKDWDDNTVNVVVLNVPKLKLEYEVIKLKNGNYLCVAREQVTLNEFQQFGYDIPLTFPTLSDVVIEIDGNNGNVVWRWNLLDHVIQDRFPSKKAYGVIKDNPGKIDINSISTADWTFDESFMINGMDYNEDLDQIVLSVRKIGEIVIIDHSTTTEEAKGSTGGRYNKGGDLIYRYGNPSNYGRGSTSDQQLYFQHNPNWIKYGEHKGKIIVFNNLFSKENYSTVQIVNPVMHTDGSYPIINNSPFMPRTPDVEYGKTSGKIQLFSPYTSGAKVMPNGNIFITEGKSSTLYEINPEGKVLWHYAIQQSNYIFRTEKYSIDYPAFKDKQLIPNGHIEVPSSNYTCDIFTNITPIESDYLIMQYPNLVTIEMFNNFELRVYDMNGMLLSSQFSNNNYLEWPHDLQHKIVILQIIEKEKYIAKKIFLH